MPAQRRELVVHLAVIGAFELDKKGGVGALGQHRVYPGVVLAHQREEAGVHDLHRGRARARMPGTASPDANTDGK